MKNFYKVLICSIILFSLFSCKEKVADAKTVCKFTLEDEVLEALNKESLDGKIVDCQKQASLFYKFTENQKIALNNLRNGHSGASVAVTLYCDDEESAGEKNVGFGFLYKSNFDEGSDYTLAVNHQPQAGLDFSTTVNSVVTVSLCVPKKGEEIVGFYVTGDVPYHLGEVKFGKAKIGWDVSSVIPVYYFGVNGGKVDFANTFVNFEGGKNVFDSENGSQTILPKIELGLKRTDDIGTNANQKQVVLKYGSEQFTILRSKKQNKFTLQTSGLKVPYSSMNFIENPSSVESVVMSANGLDLCADSDGVVTGPLVSDLGMIFNWPQKAWRNRDYELFRWEEFPSVLFFDFASYKVQNEFFTRIAYFVEKDGYKGTLVGDDFVESAHGYNAHDYKAVDLARFFSKAGQENFKLNKREQILCKILLKNGIILNNGDGTYSPGTGSVISIARESSETLRYQLMAHEAWHGIYFSDEDFRNYSDSLYEVFDSKSMAFLRTYFSTYASLKYDLTDDYLIHNEFMAYLLQQSPENSETYFTTRSNWTQIANANPSASSYVRRNEGKDFGAASKSLSEYVFNRWGFWGGRTYLIKRK